MAVDALSVVDGRYHREAAGVAELASESALIKNRVQVEVEWFLHLHEFCPEIAQHNLDPETVESIRDIYRKFDSNNAKDVLSIERTTNHDVKAVEYFVKEKILEISNSLNVELVHFCCTSEDINNLAYGLMLMRIRDLQVTPLMEALEVLIEDLAYGYVDVPMLSRTHGQPASPTTMGKEFAVFLTRLRSWHLDLLSVKVLGKFNGAVGNYNAHEIASSVTNWSKISETFLRGLGFEPNLITTQIEPHDYIAKLCNALVGYNQVLLDLNRDIWTYISMGYFNLNTVAGEVGSSTMPHKVNPIDFENSEGNIGVANALLKHFAEKLTVSRLQRDLSDSTVQRNLGQAIAHCVIAYRKSATGLSKLELDEDQVKRSLDDAWEVLTEAVQSMLRLEGVTGAYEKIKEQTHGQRLDQDSYLDLLEQLPLSQAAREKLSALTPATYIGKAHNLVWLHMD